MNKQMMNEWRSFLSEDASPAKEISDEVLKLIFSKEIDAILGARSLNESLADRAKSLAKKYGLPLAVATGLLTGAITGEKFADYQNQKTVASAQADAPKPGDYSYHRAARPPGYSDLSNSDSINKAWKDISNLRRAPAPVSGTTYTIVDGDLKTLGFSYIPTQQMSPDTVLPMSLMTAQKYREMMEARLQRSPQELLYLKNMIFGDTGKWASGVGEQVFKIEGDFAVLPPEWSIAHEVYANAVEGRLKELQAYVKENPDGRPEIYQNLGVDGDDQFHEFIRDQMFKIGRQ
jgi:hypothetical protein